MSSSRQTRGAALGAVLLVAVVLSLVMLGSAGGGRWELETRFDLFPNSNPRPVTTTTIGVEIGGENEGLPYPWVVELDFIAWTLLLVVGVVIAWTLWKLWKIYRRRLRTQQFSAPTGRPVAMPMAELPILEQGVEAALQHLDAITDSEDAIIAAWLALEEAAAATGVPRKPSQTPTEFTVAVLEGTDADSRAVAGLLRLYHLARFSDHPMTERDIKDASDHLATLARGWRNRLTSSVATGSDTP